MRKQDITYEYKLGQLRFDFPYSKANIFILVEGETDVRLFRKLFHEENCKVEYIPGGKSKLEECVEELIKQHNLLIGIRDADFIHLEDLPYHKKNIFITDFHDMEMMILYEPEIFSALISHYTALPKSQHLELRDKILRSIEHISYIKWLNEIESIGYNFSIGFGDLLSFGNAGFDIELYFSRLLGKSPLARITEITSILIATDELKQKNPDLFQLCNGKDLITAIWHYLRIVHNVRDINENNMVNLFMIAYTFNHYQKSTLYQDTKKWADDHHCVIY